MQKLITYLKQGKGRGLRLMLIFSILATLLSWGINYSKLEQIPLINPSFPSSSMIWLHIGFLLAGFIALWLLYIVVVGLSKFFTLIFQLKLAKGVIWRSTAITLIALFFASVLLTLIAYISATLGEIGLLFYPIIIMVLIPVLLVMLIACGLAEPKEAKKKK